MKNTIPVLHSSGLGLPAAWQQSIIDLRYGGAEAPTQYDRPGDPLSIDAMMVCEVNQPLLEPRIHSFMPGGPYDLQSYCMEVMQGVKDHWIRKEGEAKERWSYTYHGRICRDFGVDQLSQMVEKLSKQPFTRQAQFTTWKALTDPGDFDPPCLQRGWCRILENVKTKELEFHSHIYFRSRDALKAAFMNSFAFVRLFDEMVRQPVQKNLGRELHYVRHVDVSDSYHIYGKDLKDLPAFDNCLEKFYGYEGDWKEMMEEETTHVMKVIEDTDANRKGAGDA